MTASIPSDAATTPSSDTPDLDPQPVEHVDEIFRREIAGGSRRVRAAAEPAGGTVERGDSER